MTILPVNNFILNSVTCVLYSEDVDYCILIDCGEYETLKPVLDRINKKVKAVLLTNGHSFNYVNRGKKLFPYDTLEEKARTEKQTKNKKINQINITSVFLYKFSYRFKH